MDQVFQDIRFALRRLQQSPGFTAAAIVTLALGIGANASIFTIVNTILLRPLPVRDPTQMVFLNRGERVSFSYPEFRDIRDRQDVVTGLSAYRIMPMNMSIQAGRNSRSWGYEASGNYFDLLGVRPFLGRLLRPDDDDKPGAHPVLVLSYGCWRQRFAADPNIAGKSVKINGLDYTVLGVTPPNFIGTELIFVPEVWVPITMEAQVEPGNNWMERRNSHNIWILGRLKPGVAQRQAEASLNRVAAQLAREHPDVDEGMTIDLSPLGLVGKALRGPVLGFSGVLMAVAGLVLLLACVNLAGMLLARASDRRKEIAVRLAIGASRVQLLRQLLTESLVLSIAGGIAGFLITLWLSAIFQSLQLPFGFPVNTAFIADTNVLLFSFAAALTATVLFGLAPAVQATKPDLVAALKNEAVSERLRNWHLRDVLVAGQVTLCVVLLVSSVLVVRSLQHALDLHIGFNPDRSVSVSFDLSLQGYSDARAYAFQQQAIAKVAALPGIESVGTINNMPLRLGVNMSGIYVAGKPDPPPSKVVGSMIYDITSGYFQAAGTRLLRGRNIDSRDRAGSARVAVVNESFARILLPGEDVLGKHFRFGRGSEGKPVEIVGIVEDGKYQWLTEDPTPAVFEPLAQNNNSWTTLVARTSLPPAEALRGIVQACAKMDPSLTLFNIGSVREQLALALFPARMAAIVLGAFGAIAVVLAATGVFALMAYSVSRRTREIGIRVALGARTRQVLELVLRRTVTLLAVGAVLGAGLSFLAGPVFKAVLYGVGPRDPITYLLSLAMLAAVALLACWYPARRAMRIQPSSALREE